MPMHPHHPPRDLGARCVARCRIRDCERARPVRKRAAEGEVVFAGYGGTFEQFARNELIPAFEKQTGIKVRFVVGTALSNFAKVMARATHPRSMSIGPTN